VLTRFSYVARGTRWSIAAPVVALSVLPAVLTLVRGGDDLRAAVVAAVVIGGSVTALAADDDARDVLAPVPRALAWRWADRLGLLVGATGLVWAVVLGWSLLRDPAATAPAADRTALLVAVSGLSAAGGAAADRRGGAVAPAALAGPLVVLLLSSFAYRYPELPTVVGQDDAVTWALMGSAGWAWARWERRDPYGFAARHRSR
jgi:hypothetical protein